MVVVGVASYCRFFQHQTQKKSLCTHASQTGKLNLFFANLKNGAGIIATHPLTLGVPTEQGMHFSGITKVYFAMLYNAIARNQIKVVEKKVSLPLLRVCVLAQKCGTYLVTCTGTVQKTGEKLTF